MLGAVGGEAVDRLAAGLHDEARHRRDEIRIAVDRVFLAVQMGLAVGHRVDETAALEPDRFGDRLARERRDLHQQFVGRANAHRIVERGRLLADGLGVFERLARVPVLQRDRRLGVERRLDVVDLGAAVVHAKLAVGGRVELVGGVGEQRVFDAHRVEQPLQLAIVADAEAVEAGDDVDLAVRLALGALPEVLEHALDHHVVAVDVAADEGRRVGEGDVEFLPERTSCPWRSG